MKRADMQFLGHRALLLLLVFVSIFLLLFFFVSYFFFYLLFIFLNHPLGPSSNRANKFTLKQNPRN